MSYKKSIALLKKVLFFSFACAVLISGQSVWAEAVSIGDYTVPGIITPDLVVVYGDLDLVDSFTVEGDLKVVGGSIKLEGTATNTVDLYVYGDLIVTNEGSVNSDATISIPTGKLVVEGEIFTRSENGNAFIDARYGISAGRIATAALDDAYILSADGSIDVKGDVLTVGGSSAYVKAGNSTGDFFIKAGSITTRGIGTGSGDAYIWADGFLEVNDCIKTESKYGQAYVYSAQNADGFTRASSIFTDGDSDSSVRSGNFLGDSGNIDVANDLVARSRSAQAEVRVYGLSLSAENVLTEAYGDSWVKVAGSIDVRGDIVTKSLEPSNVIASVVADSGYVKARSISTFSADDAYVRAAGDIVVRDSIVTKSRATSSAGDASVSSTSGDIRAGSIKTLSALSSAYVSAPSGDLYVEGAIVIDGYSASYVRADEIYAGSIFASSSNGDAYILSDVEKINVEEDIVTKADGLGYIRAENGLFARAVYLEGGQAYVRAYNGDIDVEFDIVTNALSGIGTVESINGDITARKIKTQAPNGSNDYITAGGSATFQLVPTDLDTSKLIENARFSIDQDHEWNTELRIDGTCVFDGNGNSLTFGDDGSFLVGSDASLFFKNIKLKNIGGRCLRCEDYSGTFSFSDVTMTQTYDFIFGNGNIEVLDNLQIKGRDSYFSYESDRPSIIFDNASLIFDKGVTFSYKSTSEDRIEMVDNTSHLVLNGSELHVVEDLRLIKGTLLFDNKVELYIPTGKTLYFGNTNLADNLEVERRVDAWLNYTGEGILTNQNAT